MWLLTAAVGNGPKLFADLAQLTKYVADGKIITDFHATYHKTFVPKVEKQDNIA